MQGFVPGMLGVSHGALQFMTYEEMKNAYNQYRKLPIDSKLVSVIGLVVIRDNLVSRNSIFGLVKMFLFTSIVTYVAR